MGQNGKMWDWKFELGTYLIAFSTIWWIWVLDGLEGVTISLDFLNSKLL